MRRLVRSFACLVLGVTLSGQPMLAQNAEPDLTSLQPGIPAYYAGKYDEALQFFAQACNQTPQNSDIHYFLALCYHSMRMSQQAQ